MINDLSRRFFQSQLASGGCAPVTQFEQTASVSSLSPSGKPTWYFINMGNLKRGLVDKDESALKEQTVIAVEVKLESNHIGIIEEIADHGNVDLSAIRVTRYVAEKPTDRHN